MKNRKISGVYKIVSPSNRVYIGSSVNIYKRWREYRCGLAKSQKALNRSFIKYGVKAHAFSIILECPENERLEYERIFGNIYRSLCEYGGLNLQLPREGDSPKIYSKEVIDRWRDIGRARTFSEETRKKFSLARIGRYIRGQHPMAKIVLNTENGIYYESVKDALDAIGIKRGTYYSRLGRGSKKTIQKIIEV